MEMFRQGDVVLVKLPDGYAIDQDPWNRDTDTGKFGDIPKDRLKRGRFILVEGEVTGHAHGIPGAVASGVTMAIARMIRLPNVEASLVPAWANGANGRMDVVRLPKAATLTHEEHGTIELGAGDYAVVRQREYAGPRQESRRVFD
jgi:hypothetical protein